MGFLLARGVSKGRHSPCLAKVQLTYRRDFSREEVAWGGCGGHEVLWLYWSLWVCEGNTKFYKVLCIPRSMVVVESRLY